MILVVEFSDSSGIVSIFPYPPPNAARMFIPRPDPGSEGSEEPSFEIHSSESSSRQMLSEEA